MRMPEKIGIIGFGSMIWWINIKSCNKRRYYTGRSKCAWFQITGSVFRSISENIKQAWRNKMYY